MLDSKPQSISSFQWAIAFLPSNNYKKFYGIFNVTECGRDKHFGLQQFQSC